MNVCTVLTNIVYYVKILLQGAHMIKIAICDDEQRCIDNIIELLDKYFPKDFDYDVRSYFSGEKFLDDIKTNYADIVFMDIELSSSEYGLTGLDAIAKLKELDYNPIVFFVTNYQNYVQDIFRLQSFQFLQKPIRDDDFKKDIKRAVNQYVVDHKTIEVKSIGCINQITISSIKYIEVNQKEVLIHTKNDVIRHFGYMKSYEDKLIGYPFAKTHKSFLVNLKYITKITYNSVFLEGVDVSIPLARSYRSSFLSQFNTYCMGTSL